MNPPSNDYLPGSRPAIYYHRTTGYDNSLHGLSMPLDRNQIIDVWSQRCGNTEINCAGDIDLRGVNWVLPRYMPDFFSGVFLLQPTCGMNVVREAPTLMFVSPPGKSVLRRPEAVCLTCVVPKVLYSAFRIPCVFLCVCRCIRLRTRRRFFAPPR